MRDLELGGAGNLLGGEQHGHMESVGYDMYLRLLGEAERGKGESGHVRAGMPGRCPGTGASPKIISKASASGWISTAGSDIRTEEDASDVVDELIRPFQGIPRFCQRD